MEYRELFKLLCAKNEHRKLLESQIVTVNTVASRRHTPSPGWHTHPHHGHTLTRWHTPSPGTHPHQGHTLTRLAHTHIRDTPSVGSTHPHQGYMHPPQVAHTLTRDTCTLPRWHTPSPGTHPHQGHIHLTRWHTPSPGTHPHQGYLTRTSSTTMCSSR